MQRINLLCGINGRQTKEIPQTKKEAIMELFLPNRSNVKTLIQYPGISTSAVNIQFTQLLPASDTEFIDSPQYMNVTVIHQKEQITNLTINTLDLSTCSPRDGCFTLYSWGPLEFSGVFSSVNCLTVSADNLILFTAAALKIILAASFFFPLLSSHRALSSMRKKQNINNTEGAYITLVSVLHWGMAHAISATMACPMAKVQEIILPPRTLLLRPIISKAEKNI